MSIAERADRRRGSGRPGRAAAAQRPGDAGRDDAVQRVARDPRGEPRAPVIALQLWASVGSADDPPEMSGLAHLFEHTLFASTKRRAAGQIARELDAAGGTFRAWTSFDQTAYQILLAASYADTGIDILADVLTSATFDAGEVERARKLVAGRAETGRREPGARRRAGAVSRGVQRSSLRALGAGHRRGGRRGDARPARGRVPAHLRRAQPDAGRGRRFRRAGAEDQDRGGIRVAAQGRAAARRGASSRRSRRPARWCWRAICRRRSSGWPSTRRRSTHDDVAALDLLSAILGQLGSRSGGAGRLEQRLVRSRQLASAASSYTFASRDGGLFVVGATMAPGRLEEPARALLDEVLRLAREEVSPDELDARAHAALAGVVRDQETPRRLRAPAGFLRQRRRRRRARGGLPRARGRADARPICARSRRATCALPG